MTRTMAAISASRGEHLRNVLSMMVCMLLVVGGARAQFKCPELRGYYPDPEQCDVYFQCVGGQPEEKLCKDGLVFRDDNPKKELCDIPANVPCGDRTLLRKSTHPMPASLPIPYRSPNYLHASP